MENVRKCLRANALEMTVWASYAAIVNDCCTAWNRIMTGAKRITSITTRT